MVTWPFKERRSERGEVELLRALLKLANQLQANLELDAVVRVVATAASETFGFGEAAVLVRDDDVLRTHAAVGAERALDPDALSTTFAVDAVEALLTERHEIGGCFFVAGNDPDWDAAGVRPLAARGPLGRSAWRRGDTLLVPLRGRDERLCGAIRLGSPADGVKPSLDTVGLLGVFATHAVVAIENAREHRELQHVTRELEDQLHVRHDLTEMSRTLLAKLDQRSVFDEIARVLAELVPHDVIGIGLVDGETGSLEPAFANTTEVQALLETRPPLDHPLVKPMVMQRRLLSINGDLIEQVPDAFDGVERLPPAMLLAPLATSGEVFGVLGIGRWSDQWFGPREIELTMLFVNLAAIAVDNARTYREMERLAVSDGLTGLHNYRHFREALAAEVRRTDRYHETFCLLMMDLDHFKAVNDTVGHQQGDEVLRAVSAALRQCSRESDYLARYGGEEFVMILPRTSMGEAGTVAERIRTSVGAIDAGSPALRVSMSIGVAAYPDSFSDMDDVLRAADAALLRAKAAGRNCVRFHGEDATCGPGPVEDDALALMRGFAIAVGLDDGEAAGVAAALLAARVAETAAAGPQRGDAMKRSAHRYRGPWNGDRLGDETFDALLYCTERWDGDGYPEGLAGEQIPRAARVLAVCRAYLKQATDERGALEQLWRLAGKELDPRLVQRFIGFIRARHRSGTRTGTDS
ncbi:MAG: diguanylate cyclase [Actinobacteria bacterium]|nr:diguanylate cyclase [Actinomycetota bacterium]